jgi:hypothetical protein
MATDKKSFILYCDLIHTVNKIPDETAGKLLKHILAYVNDLNPETEDLLVEVAFEPIKQAMKRDLKKWETEINRKSQGAILGNLKRWHLDLYEKVESKEITLDEAQNIAKGRIPSHTDKSDGIAIKSIASIADSVNVSVNDSVSVNVNENVNVNSLHISPKVENFSFKNSLIEIGIEKQIIEDWLKVRKNKKAANTQTAFEAIVREIEKSGMTPNECIKKSVENSWSGFKNEWLKNAAFGKTSTQGAAHVHVEKKRTLEDWIGNTFD